MTDQSDSAPEQWPPPSGPYQPDPFATGTGQALAEGSVKTGIPLGRLGLIATIVVLGGLGGFAVWRALAAPGGAASPEEAAAQVFDAAEGEDLLGVIETMLPSERESTIEPLTDVLIELARLEVLADDAVEDDRISSLDGITIEVPDDGQPGALVYEVEPLGSSDSIQWVTVTDGQMTVTVDPVRLRDGFGERIAEWIDAEASEADMEVQIEIVDLGERHALDDPIQFAVVEEDGSWYFSVWYTVAGLATDLEPPDLVQALAPIGGDSAEAAAAQFLEGLIELDLTGAMAMLDPEEFRAAYDYWGAFGQEAAGAATDLRLDAQSQNIAWEVLRVSTMSTERNGRTVVTIDQLTIGVVSTAEGFEFDLAITLEPASGLEVDGTIQGQPFQVTVDRNRASGVGVIDGQPIEFDVDLLTYEGYAEFGPDRFDLARSGDCLMITINNEETETFCGDEFGADPGVAFDLQADYQALIDDIEVPGLTVVERDGRWYVSGFPSYAYAVVDILKSFDAEEFNELLDSYEDLLEQLEAPDF